MSHGTMSLSGARRLGLAFLVAGALLAAGGLSAQAAGNEDGHVSVGEMPIASVDPGTPSPVDPGTPAPDAPALGTPEPAAPAPVSPSASAAGPAAAPSAGTSAVAVRATASASKSVSIVDFAFKPAGLSVNSGDTVKWTNKDAAPEGHDVTGDGLDSGLMKQGDTYSHTFTKPGTFSYICTIHPQMKGSVRVRASSSSTGGDCPSSSCDPETAGSGTGSSTDVSGTTESGVAGSTGSSPLSSDTSSTLAFSGWDPVWLVVAGLLLLDIGLALRIYGPARTGG
jgi:plastocyanin